MKILEINDLTEAESLEYLKKRLKRRELDQNLADKIYDLTGGRFVLIDDALSDLMTGKTFDSKKILFF